MHNNPFRRGDLVEVFEDFVCYRGDPYKKGERLRVVKIWDREFISVRRPGKIFSRLFYATRFEKVDHQEPTQKIWLLGTITYLATMSIGLIGRHVFDILAR